jgi:hypothetical protein
VFCALARLEQQTAASRIKETRDVDIPRQRFMRTFPLWYSAFEFERLMRDIVSAFLALFRLVAEIMTYFKPTELGE